jgi:glycosyltransferase 2 family protein
LPIIDQVNARSSRRFWLVFKLLAGLAVLAAVGWQFARDLQSEHLQSLHIRPAWLVLSGLCYAGGMLFSALFWWRLLRVFGQRPTLAATVRAHYVSQLGKYLPGKAWTLMMRGTLISGPDVKLGVALIATIYEVLTSMASGALIAAVVFVVHPPALLQDSIHPSWLGAGLLALCGLPLLPAFFNRLVARLARRFQNVESFQLPRLGFATLLGGLLMTASVWFCFGLGVWAAVQGVAQDAPGLTLRWWTTLTAITALAYVGGFVVVVAPGGMGVREWVLDRFLAPELALAAVGASAPITVVIALVLRLTWTATELVAAGAAFWLPGPRRTT